MKGVDMLAKACTPDPVAPEPAAKITTLTDDQCNQIAQKVISLLQSGLPDQKDPEPAPEPSPDPEAVEDLSGGEEE